MPTEPRPKRIQRKTIRLSLPQFRIVNYLRGTGRYVGAEALSRERGCFQFNLRTLLKLSRLGLIEHAGACGYRLTYEGREWHRVGRPLKFTMKRWRDEHFNHKYEIAEKV